MQPNFIPPVANRSRPKTGLPIMAIVIGVLVVIAIGVGLLVASNANNPTSSMDQLNARMTALTSYVGEGRKSARSADLVKANSDASILLSGDATAIKSATEAAGAKGQTKDVVASEKATAADTLKTLKAAAVDGRFDREYIRTMEAQLTNTQALLQEVNEKSSSRDVKATTKTAYNHITTILTSLNALDL